MSPANNNSGSTPAPNALPHKEMSLFKQILRQYEHKQYKKGLKSADQILKKFPEHGETLAMRGLFLSHLDNKTEAYECVKKGLRFHLTSPICWHVYGLLYRMDKNYEEAMKCYRFALKYDKDNIQVLRDFSFLQIQMRDYEGFNETKSRLLHLRPNQRAFWIGLAISYHLVKNYDDAVKVIDAFLDTEKESNETKVDYEHSELLLYKNEILFDSGDYDKSLENLKKIERNVLDKVSWLERKANCLVKLGKLEEAEKCYVKLLDINCNSLDYINGYMTSKNANANDQTLPELEKLLVKYPRSHPIKRMRLQYSKGETFRKITKVYMMEMLRKGVPSLFSDLKPLFHQEDKLRIIDQICMNFLENLQNHQSFSTAGEIEPPSAYAWLLFFLSQMASSRNDPKKALEYINTAIEHTPTLLELYMAKARIYKRAGDVRTAAFYMNEARLLDLQDRFINSKCTKYYIRNDEVSTGEKTIALFVRPGENVNKLQDLIEMQCMWFALETAASYKRQGYLGLALKKFHQVAKHFVDITDDQFDFHTYCLRKMTVCSYMKLLKVEDNLHEHHYFLTAAKGAVSLYLSLFDNKELAKQTEEKQKIYSSSLQTNNENDGLSDAERKKKLSKLKKAQAQEKEQKDQQKPDQSKLEKAKDEDPYGLTLLNCADPIVEAQAFLKPLQMLQSKNIDTHVLSFEVFIRKKKYLLAYKSIVNARQIDANHEDVHRMTVVFCKELYLENVFDSLDSFAQEIIQADKNLIHSKSTADFHRVNSLYLKKSIENKNLDQFRIACMLIAEIEESKATEASKTLVTDGLKILKDNVSSNSVDSQKELSKAVKCLEAIQSLNANGEYQMFKQKCHDLFPMAAAFLEKGKEAINIVDLESSIASLALNDCTETEEHGL